jgi:Rho GTPase-activating protein 1
VLINDHFLRVGHPVSLPTINDPHLAAVLLKKFFRDLPEPIFNDKIYSHIRYTPAPSDHAEPQDTTSVAYIRGVLIPELDKYNAPGAIVLSYVLREPEIFLGSLLGSLHLIFV